MADIPAASLGPVPAAHIGLAGPAAHTALAVPAAYTALAGPAEAVLVRIGRAAVPAHIGRAALDHIAEPEAVALAERIQLVEEERHPHPLAGHWVELHRLLRQR